MSDAAPSPDGPLKLGVIVASTRTPRFGDTVLGWFLGRVAERGDYEVDLIDLRELALPTDLPNPAPPEVDAFRARIAAADAFVVVTPEYNHGYPAPLKNAIDLCNPQWHTKPVGFVSYGGVSGGLRAVEQLRLVFPEVHATCIRDSVSFAMARAQFADGEPVNAEAVATAATILLDKLSWWGRALRTARAAEPYVV